MIEFRKSLNSDRESIIHIMTECFGIRNEKEYLNNIENGRYMLSICDGIVVAMSGILYDGIYGDNCPEIDWTATLPEYRGRGIMTKLLSYLLKDFHGKVYYSAWRVHGNNKSNPQSILENLGFNPVLTPREAFSSGHNCEHKNRHTCVFYDGEGCTCYEDLWILQKD